MGKPKQATTRYRRSKGKGRALQLQAARLKRNIHQLVENSSEVADESFDLEQVQQQRFDEGVRIWSNTLHKSGICISYSDTLLLYDHWALKDVEVSETCPPEIANDRPAIVIVDNDDFKVDTTTGCAT
ncbi:hypothetical protein ACOMHN_048484 [Nucella lapillus]